MSQNGTNSFVVANLMAINGVEISSKQPVQLADGDCVFLLVQLPHRRPYQADITATFKFMPILAPIPMPPPSSPLPTRQSKQAKQPDSSGDSQPIFEFFGSSQSQRAALISPPDRTLPPLLIGEEDIDLEQAPQDRPRSASPEQQLPPHPSPKKSKKSFDRSLPHQTSYSSESHVAAPSELTLPTPSKPTSRVSSAISSFAKMERVQFFLLGFPDVDDLNEPLLEKNDAAIAAGNLAIKLRRAEATVLVSQFTLFEEDLKQVDVVCLAEDAFYSRQSIQHFLLLRRNPRVEFVSPTFLTQCLSKSQFLDFPSLASTSKLRQSGAQTSSRLFGSDLLYLLLDESVVESLQAIRNQLDVLGEVYCQKVKLKLTCSVESILERVLSPQRTSCAVPRPQVAFPNRPCLVRNLVLNLASKRQILESSEISDRLPQSLHSSVAKALTLLNRYCAKCRDVVLVSSSELVRRQASLWQIQVVNPDTFPFLLRQHTAFVDARASFLSSPASRWDAQGQLKR